MPKKHGTTSLTMEEQEKVKMLVAMGKSYHAVAKEIGRDEKTVKKCATAPEAVDKILEKKRELVDWYEDLAKRMLSSITDQDIEKINAYQRTLSAAVATDKMRLLNDQSTENVAAIVAVIKRIKEQDGEA